MSKQKKKSASKQKKQTKKGFPVKKLPIALAALALVAGLAVLIIFTSAGDSAAHELRSSHWASQTARNASGDEADIREVYNVRYSQYQGRLEFDKDDRFELWLRPGDATDGTHSGTYEIKGDKAEVVFDDGTKSEFTLIRSNGAITQIELQYDGYTVGFVPDKNYVR